MPELIIRPARASDIPEIVRWARSEEFAPGFGDVDIYRNTDKQGVWVGWVDSTPVGCIAGIKYNNVYGFIGLYIVRPEYRGQGYGHRLWEQALRHLQDVKCVGLEAASHLITNYAEWGFKTSSQTIRWQLFNSEVGLSSQAALNPQDLNVVSGPEIPLEAIKKYDSEREFTARPHFFIPVVRAFEWKGDCFNSTNTIIAMASLVYDHAFSLREKAGESAQYWLTHQYWRRF
jgi:ribosomal-protein-alanine N-acetyltransferase